MVTISPHPLFYNAANRTENCGSLLEFDRFIIMRFLGVFCLLLHRYIWYNLDRIVKKGRERIWSSAVPLLHAESDSDGAVWREIRLSGRRPVRFCFCNTRLGRKKQGAKLRCIK